MKIIRTANYKKLSFDVNSKKELAYELLEWHGGQNSALYRVGSSWLAEKYVPTELIDAAIGELQEEIDNAIQNRTPHSYSTKDVQELEDLKGRLNFEKEDQIAMEDFQMQGELGEFQAEHALDTHYNNPYEPRENIN
jgi:hypothetical protein